MKKNLLTFSSLSPPHIVSVFVFSMEQEQRPPFIHRFGGNDHYYYDPPNGPRLYFPQLLTDKPFRFGNVARSKPWIQNSGIKRLHKFNGYPIGCYIVILLTSVSLISDDSKKLLVDLLQHFLSASGEFSRHITSEHPINPLGLDTLPPLIDVVSPPQINFTTSIPQPIQDQPIIDIDENTIPHPQPIQNQSISYIDIHPMDGDTLNDSEEAALLDLYDDKWDMALDKELDTLDNTLASISSFRAQFPPNDSSQDSIIGSDDETSTYMFDESFEDIVSNFSDNFMLNAESSTFLLDPVEEARLGSGNDSSNRNITDFDGNSQSDDPIDGGIDSTGTDSDDQTTSSNIVDSPVSRVSTKSSRRIQEVLEKLGTIIPRPSARTKDFMEYFLPQYFTILFANRSYDEELTKYFLTDKGRERLVTILKYIKERSSKVKTHKILTPEFANELRHWGWCESIPKLDILEGKDQLVIPNGLLSNFLKLFQKLSPTERAIYDLIVGPQVLEKSHAGLNKYVESLRIITADKTHGEMDLEKALLLIIRVIIAWTEEKNENNKGDHTFVKLALPKLLRIRFTWDGRKITWANVGFFFVPIHEAFPSQLWLSALAILAYVGDETIEYYKKYAQFIADFIEKYDGQYFTVQGYDIKIEFITAPDLKALKSARVVDDALKEQEIAEAILIECRSELEELHQEHSETEKRLTGRRSKTITNPRVITTKVLRKRCTARLCGAPVRKSPRKSRKQSSPVHPYNIHHKLVLEMLAMHGDPCYSELTTEEIEQIVFSKNPGDYCERICFMCGCTSNQITKSLTTCTKQYWRKGVPYPLFFKTKRHVLCTLHAGERLVELMLRKTHFHNRQAMEWMVSYFMFPQG